MNNKKLKRMRMLIEKEYEGRMTLDGLPVRSSAEWMKNMECSSQFIEKRRTRPRYGFSVGVPSKCEGTLGEILLNNHLHFTVHYHALSAEEAANYDETDLSDGSQVLKMKKRRRQNKKKDEKKKKAFVGMTLEETGTSASAPQENKNATQNSAPQENKNATQNSAPQENKNATQNSAPQENKNATQNSAPQENKNAGRAAEGDDDELEPVEKDFDVLRESTVGDGEDILENEEDEDTTLYIIVDVVVEPFSIDWKSAHSRGSTEICKDINSEGFENEEMPEVTEITVNKLAQIRSPLSLKSVKEGRRVQWTYSANWVEEPEVHWATRWDSYFKQKGMNVVNTRAHYVSVMYSIAVVFALFSTVAMVFFRILCRDVAQYRAVLDLTKDAQEAEEERGWKAIRGDVFRLPLKIEELIVCVASGSQLLIMISGTLTAALFGFASPSNRGSSVSLFLIIFLFSAVIGGFTAARLSSVLGRQNVWPIILKVSAGVPGLIYGILLFCNIIFRLVRSTGAVPYSVFTIFFLIWLCGYVPLTVVGAKMETSLCIFQSFLRFRGADGGGAMKINPIPRPLPARTSKFYQNKFIFLFTGLTPILVVLFELRLIFAALYQGITYYFFGFLTVTFILWLMTCALISVSTVYFRFTTEDYRWWWLSFAAPSSFGLHLIICILYFYFAFIKTTSFAATLLFFSYMFLITVIYVLGSGAVGFLSTWAFVRILFATIKFD